MLTSRNAEGMSARFGPALQTCVNLSLLQPRLLLWSQMRTPTTHQLEKKKYFYLFNTTKDFQTGEPTELAHKIGALVAAGGLGVVRKLDEHAEWECHGVALPKVEL